MRWSLTFAAALLLAATSHAAPRTVDTETGTLVVENLVGGLDHPWGMAFLPDGRLLVTERDAGSLRILGTDGRLSAPLPGTPEVFARGQGGLLDVALDPNFRDNRLVYLSFAEPGGDGASTAVGRGKLENGRIENFEVLFRQQPKVGGEAHFGGRIAFSPQGQLFLTLGERFLFEPAQDLSNHLGTVVRLNRDGSIPEDNPFVGDPKAEDAIWSYGHRNIEAAATHPDSGQLWIGEMGPQGGDELNLPRAGGNYGWPVVSWGEHYSGEDIPDPPTHPRFADAIRHWTPVISPSGMHFYRGELIPQWRGNLLLGSLTQQQLVRLQLEGEQVVGEERIPLGARIRDVTTGPDGAVYLLTDQDEGNVWRLRPAG